MHKAVIFDSDGMLSHGPRFSETYVRERGISMDLMTPFFTGPFGQCIVGKADLKEELQKGWFEKWGWTGTVDEFLDYWFSVGDKLDQNVFDSIAALRAKGMVVALASNQEKYRMAYLSEKFGYEDAFEVIFASSSVGEKKPTEAFWAYVFTALSARVPNLEKEDVLFWDDDPENVQGAAAFGFDSRLFTDAESYRKEMEELGFL